MAKFNIEKNIKTLNKSKLKKLKFIIKIKYFISSSAL